jgi:small subunit ribosomal protein S12e
VKVEVDVEVEDLRGRRASLSAPNSALRHNHCKIQIEAFTTHLSPNNNNSSRKSRYKSKWYNYILTPFISPLTNIFQSDGEEPTSPVAEANEVEISGDASAGKGQMSILDALKGCLKIALIHDGLARGLREASKALDRRQAHMCVLNEACEEEAYKKLVIALCSEHKIPLIKVPDGKQLGEWSGLCKFWQI